jgi:hypothetical protein
MINSERDLILTRHPVKREGVKIPRALYTATADFIIRSIRRSERINLQELITQAVSYFPDQRNISWYIYHVKLDLEARGFIKVMITNDIHDLVIRFTTFGKKQLASERWKSAI